MRRQRLVLRASGFAESNRRRMMAFWKAPGVFTFLMTAALWVSWIAGTGAAELLTTGRLEIDVPLGPDGAIGFFDIGYLVIGFGLTAIAVAMPVFVACLVFLFPLRLADEETFLSKPVVWKYWIVTLCTLGGAGAYAIRQGEDGASSLAEVLPRTTEDAIMATTFLAAHAAAGWFGARWLIRSAGLTETDQPDREF